MSKHKLLYGYCGKLGSGKFYCMSQEIERLKTTGNTIYLTSFADPLKQILRNCFGITKEGIVETPTALISPIYVKHQIIDQLYTFIKPLRYPQFKELKESQLKAVIARNYEDYESGFYSAVFAATQNENYDANFRRAAQLLGTELGRNVADSIWVDIAFAKVTDVFQQDLADYAFIDDVRFLNEYEAFGKFNKTKYSAIVKGVVASDETRARRRKLTMEQLSLEGSHGSETGIDAILAEIPLGDVINNEG